MRKLTAVLGAALLTIGLVIGAPAVAEAKKPTPLTVNPTHPVRAVAFTVTGKLPTKVVRPVELQYKAGKKWKKLTAGKTASNGSYHLVTTTTANSLSLRVTAKKVKIKKKTYKKVTTKTKTITTVAPTTPSISIYSLPLSAVTVRYSAQLTVVGGVAPYRWSTTSLPAGLVLNAARGTITGTPSAPGLYPVTATVTDALGKTSTRSYNLRVGDSSQLVAAGSAHSCAVTTAGEVWCWGNNGGRLGDGTGVARSVPVKVKNLSPVVAVVAGTAHTCALKADATIACWGSNADGQLGINSTTTKYTPVTVSSGGYLFSSISAGGDTTCAVTQLSQPFCWGANDHGQVGDGTTANRLVPTWASLQTSVTQIAVGSTHVCALNKTGAAKCWGRNSTGQLGNGTLTDSAQPVAVTGMTTGAVKITAGSSHTCALTNTSQVRCWGENGSGQLGTGGTADSSTPQTAVGAVGAIALSAGGARTCMISSTHAAKCWGANNVGQLGDGTTTGRLSPTLVTSLDQNVTTIVSGGFHTLAVKSGVLLAWGANSSGQLGNGSNVVSLTPNPVNSLG